MRPRWKGDWERALIRSAKKLERSCLGVYTVSTVDTGSEHKGTGALQSAPVRPSPAEPPTIQTPQPGPIAAGIAPPSISGFQLIKCIGRGSYGDVWLARSVTGAYRAIKIVHRATFDSDRPYEREFEGLKKFEPISRSHESQVAVLHVGRETNCFYYVMELADDAASPDGEPPGRTPLAPSSRSGVLPLPAAPSDTPLDPATYRPKTLKSELLRQGRLRAEACVSIGLGLATALEHLHQNGLAHRDVKLSNIIFVHGRPKLADIGLVAAVDATCSFVGTEGYLPPEGPGTPQADLYSLGKVLYEISSGKDRLDYPEPPTLLGEFADREEFIELGAIIKKACAREPAARYQSAQQMHVDLLLLMAGKSVRQTHDLERRLKLAKRLALAAVAVLLLGVAPYAVAIREARQARREAARAKTAEADAEQKLWRSYLAEAQALRWSHHAGRRFEALELLGKAAEIRPALELRNEAIACLALPDMRLARQWDGLTLPDGLVDFDFSHQRYVCSDAQGNLSLRNLQDDREQFTLAGKGVAVGQDLAFSPDGRYLVAGYDPTLTQVWDLERRNPALVLTNFCLRGRSFSPDGSRVALAQRIRPPGRQAPESGMLHLYGLRRGDEIWSTPVRELPIAVRFSPSARAVAVCFLSGRWVDLIDTASGQMLRQLPCPVAINDITWHPDGDRLVGAGGDGRIYVWDLTRTNNPTDFAAHAGPVMRVEYSRHGDWLASSAWDDAFRLSEASTGGEILSQQLTIAFFRKSEDDRWWGHKRGGNQLGVWEAATERETRIIRNETAPDARVVRADLSPDGRRLAVACQDGVRLWDLQTGKALGFLPLGWTYDLAFAPSGQTLWTCSEAGLQEWPLLVDNQSNQVAFGPVRHLGSAGTVLQIARLQHEGLVYLQDGRVHVMDTPAQLEKPPMAAEVPYAQLAVSPDGKLLAAWGRPADVFQIREVPTGRTVQNITGKGGGEACFSPNGRWLALGDRRGYQVVEVGTWKTLLSERTTTDLQVLDLVFSPDNAILAVSLSRTTVLLLDTTTWTELARLEAPEPRPAIKLNFSPDGAQLVATCNARLIQVWDLRLIRSELAALKLDW